MRGRFVLLLASGGILLVAFALPRLRFDHEPRSLLRVDPDADRLEDELVRTFGSDDILLLAWEVPDLLTPAAFRHLEEVTGAIAALPGLDEVYSLASDPVRLPLGLLPRRLRESDLKSPEGRDRARRALLAASIYRGTLYNDDLDVLAVATTLAPASREARHATVDRVQEAARRLAPPGGLIHVSGVSAFAREAADYAVRDLLSIGALALLASLLALFGLAGSALQALLAAMATVVPPLFALSAAAALDLPVTAMGAALFPVLAVVGITNSLHLLNHYGESRRTGATGAEAAWAAARAMRGPVILGLGTTAAAFFSLTATGVPAFHAGGSLVGLGALIAIPVVLVALPAALAWLAPAGRPPLAGLLDRPLVRTARFAIRRAPLLLCAGTLLVAAGIFFAARGSVAVAVLEAFRPDTTIARTYRFLDRRLTATVPVDAVLSARPGATTTEILADLERFAREIEMIPGVASAQSLATLVAFGRAINPVPIGDEGALAVLRGGYAHITRRFEHQPTRRFRVKVRVREGSPPEVLDRMRDALQQMKSGEATLTGLYVRAVGTTRSLARDLAQGTLLMVGLILVVVFLAFRSFRLVLASILPNLLPPALVFGGAALAGVRFDVSAIAVSAVAVGLAIDGTLHLLFRLVGEGGGRGALIRAQRSVGRALVLSTLVLVGGLTCLGLSAFLPTARFGLFTALTCAVALLGDLLLLPAGVIMTGWSARRS